MRFSLNRILRWLAICILSIVVISPTAATAGAMICGFESPQQLRTQIDDQLATLGDDKNWKLFEWGTALREAGDLASAQQTLRRNALIARRRLDAASDASDELLAVVASATALEKAGLKDDAEELLFLVRKTTRELPKAGTFGRAYWTAAIAKALAQAGRKRASADLFDEAERVAEQLEATQYEQKEEVRSDVLMLIASARMQAGDAEGARNALLRVADYVWRIPLTQANSMHSRLLEVRDLVKHWLETGDVDKATTAAREILDPAHRANALSLIVAHFSKIGERSKAEPFVKEILGVIPHAIGIGSSSEDSISEVAQSLAAAGWPEAAIRLLPLEAEAARKYPGAFSTQEHDSSAAIAAAYAGQGRQREAKRLFEQIPPAHPKRAEAAQEIAARFFAANTLDQGREWKALAKRLLAAGDDLGDLDTELWILADKAADQHQMARALALVAEVEAPKMRRQAHLAVLRKLENRLSLPRNLLGLCELAGGADDTAFSARVMLYRVWVRKK